MSPDFNPTHSERTCDRCGRVGTVGYKPGKKPGAWICESAKACSRRLMRARYARTMDGL